jgi:anaerobic selenocysteine-containing dehydrogenase
MVVKVSRRSFLKLAGAATAGTMLLGSFSWTEPRLRALAETGEKWTPGMERWIPSVCFLCDAGCGIRVRVVEGRAVKIEGNPLYPTNAGGLCPKGQAGLQVLYDPDRIKYPLERAGQRGSGQWRRISWVDALERVISRLKSIRERGEPHTLAVLGSRYRGQTYNLIARFMEAFGSPNHIVHPYIGLEPLLQAHYFTQGVRDFLGYDLENTNYLLSFGAAFCEAWRPTAEVLKLYGLMRRGRSGIRAKIVQIEPRLSLSAVKADEWVPLPPGRDGILALGLAHVIIKEELYDARFLAENTFGFEDWTDSSGMSHLGFRNLVLRDYPPEFVSEVTGVPRETIVRLAREFATHRPSLAVGGRGAGGNSNGTYNLMAIHALNALVGSIGVSGGIVTEAAVPFTELAPVQRDSVAEAGLAMPRLDGTGTSRFPLATAVTSVLPENILSGEPYPVDTLFLCYTNPLFSQPHLEKFHQALQKVPFIVSFSPFLDDSARMADLILPDSTYLERWQDEVVPSALGIPVLGLRQPVVPPLYDTANTGDVFIYIAKKLGGSIARSFPWNNFLEMLREAFQGIQQAQRGSIIALDWEEFWRELQEKGGWWDTPPPRRSVFATPSGKFEFYSQIMKRRLEELAAAEARRKGTSSTAAMETLLQSLGIEARGDKVYLPHYELPRFAGEEEDYPFYLNTFKTMTLAQGRGENVPWLLEIYGLHVQQRWNSWVEIHPDTARELGIVEGDPVWIESPLGRIKAEARLYPGTMPGVINMPFGWGHKAGGRWIEKRGVNPNWVLAGERDSLSGAVAWSATRVRVYKA